MRIALIYDAVYPFIAGGVERRNYSVAEELRSRHGVSLYGFRYWTDGDDACLSGCHYVALGRPVPLYRADGRRRVREALMFAARLFAALLRSDEEVWDVANFPFFSVPIAWFASRLRRRALVVTWYEFWGDYWYRYLGWQGIVGRLVELAALWCSPRVIATSELTRRRLVAAGCAADRITLVPCGVDLESLGAAPAVGDEYDLICVGRLLPHKRVELAIEALAFLRQSRPSARLAVVGDGPERCRLRSLAATLDLDGAVRFFGKLPKAEQVYGLMKSSRVLVAPSAREGFGIVVVEGWACGLPAVVCSGSENGMAELINEPFKGRVVPPSAQEIAAACHDLFAVNDASDRRRLFEAAADFEWSKIAAKLEAVYREALVSAQQRQKQ